MYAKEVIADTVRRLEEARGVDLVPHTPAECAEWIDRLAPAVDEEGNVKWELSREERAFIDNELLLCKADWAYFAQRYIIINKTANTIGPMYPLLGSQEFILQKIAQIELEIFEGRRDDGILVNLLKGGRQTGGSTLAEAIIAHRISTQGNLYGLIASDDPGGSAYLFGMMEQMIERLPWWLKPTLTDQVKNTELKTDAGSHIWIGSGKSMRGTAGQRGQLGRGKSLSLIHLSEVSTWEASSQIDDSLLPTIPRNKRVFVMLESTAKGRHNWWHRHWDLSKSVGRFDNVFTPWYMEKKYALHPPADWSPNDETLAHARHCTETSTTWIGHEVKLTRAQLYWYEQTRAYYEAKDKFRAFLEEYGSVNDEDCFQSAGYSIFPAQLQQRIKDRARPLAGVVEVVPMRDAR
jgi:hypothetical protein